MKRFIKIWGLILSFCLLAFISCNKEQKKIQEDVATLENPYDFVGELHNEGLSFVMNSGLETKSESKESEIERLTTIFCDKVYTEDDRFKLDIETRSDIPDYVVDSSEFALSEEVEGLYEEIIKIAETNNYEYIKNQFQLIENSIMNSIDNYTDYEQAYLLCSIAVGKYSNEYWNANTTKSDIEVIIAADLIGAGKGIAKHAAEIVICGTIGGIGCGLAAAGRAALWPAIRDSLGAGIMCEAQKL